MTPLLRRATSDDRAFERLYRRHVEDVFRYSLAVLGTTADAEDVTQTTFLNAYRAFKRGERPQKPEHWLIAIAHNVCRQRFRQAQRRPHEVAFEDELGGAVERDENGPTAADLRRAFQQLPPSQRAALVMRELEGRSYAEIAGVLEITVSALETLLFRARRTLREQLEERLTCNEAERAISKQIDGRLAAVERRALRAHLRGCSECASLAQSQRAQRRALRTLLAVPLPSSLASFVPHGAEVVAATGTGGAVAGGVAGGVGLAAKAAAVIAAGTVVGGGAYEGATHTPQLVRHRPVAVSRVATAPPTRTGPSAVAVPVPARAAAPPARTAAGKPEQPRSFIANRPGQRLHKKGIQGTERQRRHGSVRRGHEFVRAVPVASYGHRAATPESTAKAGRWRQREVTRHARDEAKGEHEQNQRRARSTARPHPSRDRETIESGGHRRDSGSRPASVRRPSKNRLAAAGHRGSRGSLESHDHAVGAHGHLVASHGSRDRVAAAASYRSHGRAAASHDSHELVAATRLSARTSRGRAHEQNGP